ncbi:MAG: site-specific DNA-methyltransferase [Chloroflexi bacterium]|nr:site-specific DNA-methyltransferase [Chloroflexota bacterium]
MSKKTKTSSFGVSKREGHDSSNFYNRKMYTKTRNIENLLVKSTDEVRIVEPVIQRTNCRHKELENTGELSLGDWKDKIYLHSSEDMPIPSNSVALAFTSPPYNVGKDYDDDISLEEYFGLIRRVAQEVYRVLLPGGRYVINIANLGRKPYIPMHAHFYNIHEEVGFLPMGEIIWQKGKGANGSCAWGSWQSAKSPRLRDLHEYLLVFAKSDYTRKDKGISDISREEFMEATLSVWQIPPESAKRVGHPAPFPVDLAARVIKLYSYVDDVVLDPFVGSGTTCVAAKKLDRHYIGFDISKEYVDISQRRLAELDYPNSQYSLLEKLSEYSTNELEHQNKE